MTHVITLESQHWGHPNMQDFIVCRLVIYSFYLVHIYCTYTLFTYIIIFCYFVLLLYSVFVIDHNTLLMQMLYDTILQVNKIFSKK